MSCTAYVDWFQAMAEPFLQAQNLVPKIWGSGPLSDGEFRPIPPLRNANLRLQTDNKVPNEDCSLGYDTMALTVVCFHDQ